MGLSELEKPVLYLKVDFKKIHGDTNIHKLYLNHQLNTSTLNT